MQYVVVVFFGLGYVVLKGEEGMIVLLEVSLGFIVVFVHNIFVIIFLTSLLTVKRQQVSRID